MQGQEDSEIKIVPKWCRYGVKMVSKWCHKMRIFGGRSIKKILGALIQKRHRIALKNAFFVYVRPLHNLKRYLNNSGEYPYAIDLRTPIGSISLTLYSYIDMQEVDKIFCRLDYKADKTSKVIVDVGSTTGISALYFLTRNDFSRVYLYEFYQDNIDKLRKNLRGFENRVYLHKVAVADFDGPGKRESIDVHCCHVNSILEDVIRKEGKIDILKIDAGVYQKRLIRAIDTTYIQKISKLYVKGFENECILI